MASGEASPLLPTDAFNSSPPRALFDLLEWKPVLVILDWGPLILFYILESSASFLVAASSALGTVHEPHPFTKRPDPKGNFAKGP